MTQENYGKAFLSGFRRTVGMLCARGASRDRAEDAAQAAWGKGWERIHQLRNDAMLLHWVNAIALNVHRVAIRYEARFEVLTDIRSCAGIDFAQIDATRMLARCRPHDRALLEDQMGGLTTEELAGKWGASLTAVRVRLLRARRAIRDQVESRQGQLRQAVRN